MTTEQDIAQFIIQEVSAFPNIRGAELGYKVKRRFPGVIYGKLTPFIIKHCADSVVSAGQINLDYIWVPKIADNLPSANTPPVNIRPKERVVLPISMPEEELSPWKAFSRASASGKIAINPISEQITVVQSNEEEISPLIHIPSVTLEEYRNIAFEFIDQLTDSDRQHFKTIAESPLFDSQWYDNILRWRNGYFSRAWGRFRFERLCDIFVKRLAAKGIKGELIESYLTKLKHLKTKDSKKTASLTAHKPQNDVEILDFSIQDIVVAAAKNLNEEDLRRVWLPVGVVLDAIRKK